jgi:opacity protein-like surface antigen
MQFHNSGETMNRLTFVAVAAAVGIGAAASNADAQSSMLSGFQIGASAGVAIPTGDLGNVASTGYNVTLMAGFKPTLIPLGVRLEAAYNQFGLKGNDGNVNIPAFTGNLTYTFPTVSFSPYAIGGAGLYRVNVDPNPGTSAGENKFGFNIGGGIKIPLTSSFETFVEARYNHVSLDNGSFSFVPITVGILF